MNLISPTGVAIIGTAEVISGTARIDAGSVIRNPDGTFDFDYAGNTDIDFDSRETVEENGERMFVDDAGYSWPESSLVLMQDESD